MLSGISHKKSAPRIQSKNHITADFNSSNHRKRRGTKGVLPFYAAIFGQYSGAVGAFG